MFVIHWFSKRVPNNSVGERMSVLTNTGIMVYLYVKKKKKKEEGIYLHTRNLRAMDYRLKQKC